MSLCKIVKYQYRNQEKLFFKKLFCLYILGFSFRRVHTLRPEPICNKINSAATIPKKNFINAISEAEFILQSPGYPDSYSENEK